MDNISKISENLKPAIEYSIGDRARFFNKTYMHLAVAVLGFMILESVFLNTPWIVETGLAVFDGFMWLLVLGIYITATHLAENWATKSTRKSVQYVALFLYIVAEALIFVPLIYIHFINW